MSNVKVTLGDFTFMNLEVPSRIPVGGAQALAVQNLIGGYRIVDVMGAVAANLDWSGIFFGEKALVRAKYLDYLRTQGKPLVLTWSEFAYTVIIEKFHFDFEREWQLPYQISCVVVKDHAEPTVQVYATNDWDLVIAEEMNKISDDIDLIDWEGVYFEIQMPLSKTWLAVLKEKFSEFQNKIQVLTDAVNKQLTTTTSTITEIKGLIGDIQNQITQQIASVNNFLMTVTTLGGVFPYNPVTKNVSGLMTSASNFNNQVQLENIQYSLGKINKTLAVVENNPTATTSATSPNNIFPLPTTQVIQNGNLYQLASMYYGNAMKWTLIATENGLKSPHITSPITLRIPKDKNSSGGVLGV